MFDSVFTKEDVTLVNIEHIPTDTAFLGELFCALGDSGVNVDMICRPTDYSCNSELSFTVDDADLIPTLSVVGGFSEKYKRLTCSFSAGNCKLSVKDSKMADMHSICGLFFKALAKANIEILLVTTDYDEISVLLNCCDLRKAVYKISTL